MVLSCLNKLSLVVMFVLRKSIEIELSSAFAPCLQPYGCSGERCTGHCKGSGVRVYLKAQEAGGEAAADCPRCLRCKLQLVPCHVDLPHLSSLHVRALPALLAAAAAPGACPGPQFLPSALQGCLLRSTATPPCRLNM